MANGFSFDRNKKPFVVFIQARMSSSRFPGKMLKVIRGRKVLELVIQQFMAAGLDKADIVLLTSVEKSDDALSDWAKENGLGVFRGDLGDVLGRFAAASEQWPSDWVVRVTGDSPFCPSYLISTVLSLIQDTCADIVTSTYRRTFPVGANLEALRSDLLQDKVINSEIISGADREDVTSYWHRNIPPNGLLSIELAEGNFSDLSVAIDVEDDLHRAESGDSQEIVDSIPWTQLTTRLIAPE